MDIHTGKRCVFVLPSVWVSSPCTGTKCQFPGTWSGWAAPGNTCVGFGAELTEFHARPRKCTLRVQYPPTVAILRPVNRFNGASSRRLRPDFPELRAHYRQATCPQFVPCFAGLVAGPPITTGLKTSALATILVS